MAQREAIKTLKKVLTTVSALMPLQYGEEADKIIFISDISLNEWGAHLDQLNTNRKRHSSRFLSSLWFKSKKKYNTDKRECRGLLKGLKKV